MSTLIRTAGMMLVLSATPVFAQPSPQVRVGDHPAFGRVVFDWPRSIPYRVAQDGDHVTLRFEGAGAIAGASRLPRNVREVRGGAGEAVLIVAPGARVKHMRLGNRVVVDVLNPTARDVAEAPARGEPAPAAPGVTPATPGSAPEAAAAPAPLLDLPAAVPATVAASTPEPAAAPPAPIPEPRHAEDIAVAQPGPVPEAASPVIATLEEAAIEAVPLAATEPVLLAPDDAGTALFIRAGRLVAVVEHGSLPPGATLPEGTEVAMLPGALVLTTKLPAADRWPALERTRSGWRIVANRAGSAIPISVATAAEPARLRLDLPAPGGVVAVPDPETGGTLLVGTQGGPAAALDQGRVFAEFRLLPSLRGVVLVPVSDRIALRAAEHAFEVLYSGPTEGTLALTDAPPVTGSPAVRIFDFPADGLAGLHERLKRQVMEAGATPPLSRGRARADIAETMLALGLGPEAQAALRVLASDDPQIGRSARVRALAAAAALIAGRLEEARGLDDPALGGSDEIALWRAVLAAGEGRPLAAAQASRAAARLLPGHPPSLRERLAAPVVEALLEQGARQEALTVLAALPDEPTLAFARARAREAAGDPEAALALYAPLTQGHDWRVRALALRRVVEVQRASGVLSAASAADALDRQILTWRGDAFERSLRLRIAELRQEAGDPRAAVMALRDAIRLFPDHAQQLRPRIAALLAGLVTEGERIAPAEFVFLVEENADALPQGNAGIALARLLAGHLRALDLPERAAGVYERLLATLEEGEGRTEVGLALAELRIEAGDGNAALAALATSAPGVTPPESIIIARGLAAARAELARGRPESANRILDELPGIEATIMRAEQALQAGAWDDAKRRFVALLPRLVADGPPRDITARRVILHCAMAAVRGGDATLTAELVARYAASMDGTESGDAFRALTGAAAPDPGALPDLSRELAAMRSVLAVAGARR